ncbi:MAG: prolyl oligopeptidase family serine peptidase [Phycisphaerae bacterium]
MALIDFLGKGPTEIIDPRPKVEQETDHGDYIRRLITYRVEAEDQGYGYLLLPKTFSAPFPLVICPHGTKASGKDWPAGLDPKEDLQLHYAVHLVREGFACFAPDDFVAGQRLKPGQHPYDTFELHQRWPEWTAAGKSLWDLQRAVDFLVRYDFIDSSRIGAIGHSLGGHDSLILAAFDQRIRAAVINCGVALLRTEPCRKEWARTNDHDFVYYQTLRKYMDHPESLPFDFDRMAMAVSPRALLMIHALNDEYMQGNAVWLEASGRISDHFDKAGQPEVFAAYFHRQGHCFPAEVRALAYEWLKKYLMA